MESIRKTSVLIILLLITVAVGAQRLNTGVNFDFYSVNFTRFPTDVVFSETSYKAYYVKQLQAPSGMQYNIGLNLIADYSRFFVNTRATLNSTIKGTIYKMSYPIAGNTFTDYYSKISYQQSELAATFGYFIKAQKFLRPYVELGIGKTFPYIYREDFSDDKKFKTQWTGRQEIRNYLDLYESYNFMILGYGYRGDMFSFYTRYNIRLGKQEVYYSSMAFGLAVYTKFSKLRKHYIYQPEE